MADCIFGLLKDVINFCLILLSMLLFSEIVATMRFLCFYYCFFCFLGVKLVILFWNDTNLKRLGGCIRKELLLFFFSVSGKVYLTLVKLEVIVLPAG
jgi:hypothetical protein